MRTIDWNLLRDQLLAIEADKDFKSAILGVAMQDPLPQCFPSKEDFADAFAVFQIAEARVFEHLAFLIEEDLIKGIMILKGYTEYHYGLTHLRLTPKGMEILSKIRSQLKWNVIQQRASDKGAAISVEYLRELNASTVIN